MLSLLGWFYKINVLPLLAFSPDNFHKNKGSDKRSSKIEDCLGCGFVKLRQNYAKLTGPKSPSEMDYKILVPEAKKRLSNCCI